MRIKVNYELWLLLRSSQWCHGSVLNLPQSPLVDQINKTACVHSSARKQKGGEIAEIISGGVPVHSTAQPSEDDSLVRRSFKADGLFVFVIFSRTLQLHCNVRLLS